MARKILIVDSSATMRSIIRGMILANVNDAEITEASNSKEAWKRVENDFFHLMLFSWEPSGAKWLDFFKQLKQQPADPQTAAILLTSDSDRPYIRKALDAGAAEYLVTPFSPADLTGTMNRVCNPVTLRHSNRYSLPDTTALLQQEEKSIEATVINISEGGLLCEFDYAEGYKWTAPVMISVSFGIGGEKFTAVDLYSLPSRLSIIKSNPDFTPRRIKLACRFFNVPAAAKLVFEKVFGMAKMQEKMLGSEGD